MPTKPKRKSTKPANPRPKRPAGKIAPPAATPSADSPYINGQINGIIVVEYEVQKTGAALYWDTEAWRSAVSYARKIILAGNALIFWHCSEWVSKLSPGDPWRISSKFPKNVLAALQAPSFVTRMCDILQPKNYVTLTNSRKNPLMNPEMDKSDGTK